MIEPVSSHQDCFKAWPSETRGHAFDFYCTCPWEDLHGLHKNDQYGFWEINNAAGRLSEFLWIKNPWIPSPETSKLMDFDSTLNHWILTWPWKPNIPGLLHHLKPRSLCGMSLKYLKYFEHKKTQDINLHLNAKILDIWPLFKTPHPWT